MSWIGPEASRRYIPQDPGRFEKGAASPATSTSTARLGYIRLVPSNLRRLIIALVNQAYSSGEPEQIKDEFESFTDANASIVCPVNANGEVTG